LLLGESSSFGSLGGGFFCSFLLLFQLFLGGLGSFLFFLLLLSFQGGSFLLSFFLSQFCF